MEQTVLQNDLALFADLGTEPPTVFSTEDRILARLFRGGVELELEFHNQGYGRVTEKVLEENSTYTHASYKALLASPRFANLAKWADSQRILLEHIEQERNNRLPVSGRLAGYSNLINPECLDDILQRTPNGPDTVSITLIDGPAGIGKTKFIELLCFLRATNYRLHQRPLILHVESRGRVMTFIQDLIAFSLQTMRVAVTFDQVPILVRNGLVCLAIDGFDELGDPSGYKHAWGQLNDLIAAVRGGGSVILSGRDTFIGPERIQKDVNAIRADDTVRALSLQAPSPIEAQHWLNQNGWTSEELESAGELFESGSYALRPFFLDQLARGEVAETIRSKAAGMPLAFLVDLMISREITKFGEVVEASMTEEERYNFVRDLLRETARFIADDQAESIDNVMLAYLVDMVAPAELEEELKNVLRNRVSVVAFLANDNSPNRRRFVHSQLFSHFLGEVTIDVLIQKEVPKYLRRNIFGSEFLAPFGDLALHMAHMGQGEYVTRFVNEASKLVAEYEHFDRAPRNIGALLISMLPVLEYIADVEQIGPFEVDDAVIGEGIVAGVNLKGVTINQLDTRGADLRKLEFSEDCHITTLIANEATRLGGSFPVPVVVRVEKEQIPRTIVNPVQVAEWMESKRPIGAVVPAGDTVSIPGSDAVSIMDNNHPLIHLLERACRNKAYWIKMSDDDVISSRLINNQHWERLLDLLRSHDLVREEHKAAGGQRGQFVHIKRRMDILMGASEDEQIEGLYRSLMLAIARE